MYWDKAASGTNLNHQQCWYTRLCQQLYNSLDHWAK
jgi:hypothetical protein